MKLPHLELAVVPPAKIADYLLSTTHRDGQHKAALFHRFGFRAEAWEELATALLKHALEHEVVSVEPSPFGKRYVVEGIIETPDGRTPAIRSIWFIDTGEAVPRLASAYPLKGKSDD